MYWNAYKLSINDKIYRLSLGDLKWEIIKARANLESKFTFIWSSVVFGVISAAVFNYGLDVATQVIKLGEAAEQDMINTVYMNFMLMVIGFTLFISFAGWIVALFLKTPGKNAIWFYTKSIDQVGYYGKSITEVRRIIFLSNCNNKFE